MALKTISGNWSSRHLVSCSARTSMSRRCSQAATRSARLRMELTFQVASRTPADLTESRLGADLRAGDDLVAGGDAGTDPLPALDEPRRLGVQTGEEPGELFPGALAGGAEVGALEDLPLAQD